MELTIVTTPMGRPNRLELLNDPVRSIREQPRKMKESEGVKESHLVTIQRSDGFHLSKLLGGHVPSIPSTHQ